MTADRTERWPVTCRECGTAGQLTYEPRPGTVSMCERCVRRCLVRYALAHRQVWPAAALGPHPPELSAALVAAAKSSN